MARVSGFVNNDNGFSKSTFRLNGFMDYNVWIDSTYSGNFGITQIINCNSNQSFYFTDGLNLLDGSSEIYGEPPPAPPGQPNRYDPSDNHSKYVEFADTPYVYFEPCAIMIANFKDYIRFQPDGGIFVTIATVDWHMNGFACVAPGGISPNDLPPASDPVDTDVFPLWEFKYIP